MKKLTTLLLVSAVLGCRTGAPEPTDSPTIAELKASQRTAYAVPATDGDTGFTVAASMAAIRWARLDERQLLAWSELWTAVRETPARPQRQYHDEQGAPGALFDRSARDGFCVAFAEQKAGTLQEPRLVAFFEQL